MTCCVLDAKDNHLTTSPCPIDPNGVNAANSRDSVVSEAIAGGIHSHASRLCGEGCELLELRVFAAEFVSTVLLERRKELADLRKAWKNGSGYRVQGT